MIAIAYTSLPLSWYLRPAHFLSDHEGRHPKSQASLTGWEANEDRNFSAADIFGKYSLS